MTDVDEHKISAHLLPRHVARRPEGPARRQGQSRPSGRPRLGLRLNEKLDVEERGLRPFARAWHLVAHDLLHRGHDPLLHEALEILLRLPDVVDVPALLALAGRVNDATLR